jgi:hypothetical protein
MAKPSKILLQTTIPYAEDDWHIGRFSLLRDYLASLRGSDGAPLFEVVARDRDPLGAPDSVLSKLDATDFDELWLFAVDTGDGLTPADCQAISKFRRRGGGMMVTRDHMDLGSSVCTLGGVGAAHFFHSKNPDPDPSRRRRDDTYTTEISWPNYHSGSNGDYQEIAPVDAIHPVLRDPDDRDGIVRFLPAHPHEGDVGKPRGDDTARIIATGTSKVSGIPFNIAVAFEPTADAGPAIAQSTFHHFADYNWDIRKGCPNFVREPPGGSLARSPQARRSIARYVANIALWLGGRKPGELDTEKLRLDRALDEALEESFPASDPPSIGRDP